MRRALVTCGLVVCLASPLFAQDQQEDPFASIPWQEGPVLGDLGDEAQVRVPGSCLFTGADGTEQFLELTQNPTNGQERGVLFCKIESQGEVTGSWFVVFEYDESGYVKDDEKDKLDAEGILASLREGNDAANEERERRGWSRLDLVGWERAPYYDAATHNLTWAIRTNSPDGGPGLNHSVRLLGRGGVMSADLVADPTDYATALATFNSVLTAFEFKTGHRYAEWREGDKIAKYGLTALVAGGAGALAAKSGVLAKLWKVIVAGLVAAGAAIKRFFTGRKDEPASA